jgi:signal peptidase I
MPVVSHRTPASAPAGTQSPGRSPKSVVREYAEALIVAVLLALVIRTFVVQAFVIPSGSMLPTLQIGDYVLVNKFLYYFRPIQRGDIIVFKYPKNEAEDFIKRVVGLPGETLEVRGRRVFINGRPLDEAYAVYSAPSALNPVTQAPIGPIQIPAGKLFVMGDNRDNSLDSRFWGFLDAGKVRGKALLIYFSDRSEDVPQGSWILRMAYVVLHPSLIRWNRIGMLVQ